MFRKYSPTITDLSCSKHHSLTYEHFCVEHDSLCCNECLKDHHRKCQKVMSVDVAAKGVKRSPALTDAFEAIESIMETVEKLKIQRIQDVSNLDKNIQQIKAQINSAKSTFIRHIENIEKSLIGDLLKLQDEHMVKCIELDSVLKDMNKTVADKKNALATAKDNGSDQQIFLTIHISKDILRELEKAIERLIENSSCPKIIFTENRNNCPTALGDVKIEDKPSPIQFNTTKKLQSQFPVIVNQNLPSFAFNDIINIPHSQIGVSIASLTFTEDNMILMASHNTPEVMIYDSNDTYKCVIKTKYIPWDIATIPNTNRAALTCRFDEYLQLIDLTNLDLIKLVKIQGIDMSGIATSNDNILIGGRNMIYVLDHEGREVRKIEPTGSGKLWGLALGKNGNIYGSDMSKVVCLQPDGTQLFTYKSDKLELISKLTTDMQGNIYIIGSISHNIHRIRSDGTFIDIILKKEDGIDRPLALCFNKQCTKLYVANKSGTEISVFTVS